MNRMFKRGCVLLLTVLLAAACSTTSPRTFERVVADAEQNGAKYNEEDWNRADDDFQRFCQRYNYDRLKAMSEEKQREVGRLMARYIKTRVESSVNDFDTLLKTGATLLKGFAEGLGLELEEGDDDKE